MAVLEALDLVVTVDTAVAHLAGAMGRPVWLMLPFAPDWRWPLNRADSPWYPSARLFRQPAPLQWEPVVAEIAGELG
jgi:ADP-heptose:LPS heptosyltransferase